MKSISAAIESLSLLLDAPTASESASSSILLPPTTGGMRKQRLRELVHLILVNFSDEEKVQTKFVSEKRAFGSTVRSLIDLLSAKNLKQIYNCKEITTREKRGKGGGETRGKTQTQSNTSIGDREIHQPIVSDT